MGSFFPVTVKIIDAINLSLRRKVTGHKRLNCKHSKRHRTTRCQYLMIVHLGISDARLKTRAATSAKFLQTALVHDNLLLPRPDQVWVKIGRLDA